MHARVTTFTGSPDRVEEGLRNVRDSIMPMSKKQPGFKAGYWLVDRKSGTGMAITMWESEAAMRASEEAASKLREQAQQATPGTKITGVLRYEVGVTA